MVSMNAPWSGTRALVTGGSGFLGRVVVEKLKRRGADVVAIMYGTNQKSSGNRFNQAPPEDTAVTGPYGLYNIAGTASMALRRVRVAPIEAP